MTRKLTIEDLTALIDYEEYYTAKTLTICILHLKNGAMVTGESNVIDPANYDAELGRKFSRDRAINKIWELEGYACKTRGFPEA